MGRIHLTTDRRKVNLYNSIGKITLDLYQHTLTQILIYTLNYREEKSKFNFPKCHNYIVTIYQKDCIKDCIKEMVS